MEAAEGLRKGLSLSEFLSLGFFASSAISWVLKEQYDFSDDSHNYDQSAAFLQFSQSEAQVEVPSSLRWAHILFIWF